MKEYAENKEKVCLQTYFCINYWQAQHWVYTHSPVARNVRENVNILTCPHVNCHASWSALLVALLVGTCPASCPAS
jgi:hypothetical protein